MMFEKFRAYESKPITRMALVIDGNACERGANTYEYDGITFKAYERPKSGDYICRLTEADTYHVSKSVFEERNIVPGVNDA